MRIIAARAAVAQETVRLAGIQVTNTAAANKNEQIRNAERHLEIVSPFKGRVDLVCFPELSTAGFPAARKSENPSLHDYDSLAETTEFPLTEFTPILYNVYLAERKEGGLTSCRHPEWESSFDLYLHGELTIP